MRWELILEVYNNTIIVIIGDHGFSLGEKHIGKSPCYGKQISVQQ